MQLVGPTHDASGTDAARYSCQFIHKCGKVEALAYSYLGLVRAARSRCSRVLQHVRRDRGADPRPVGCRSRKEHKLDRCSKRHPQDVGSLDRSI